MESKFNGDIGVLHRRHLKVRSIVHIGKESNNLEQSFAFGVSDDDYCTYCDDGNVIDDDMRRFINQFDIKAAEKCGIGRRSLDRWKQMVANGKSLKLNPLSVKRLEAAMSSKKLDERKRLKHRDSD